MAKVRELLAANPAGNPMASPTAGHASGAGAPDTTAAAVNADQPQAMNTEVCVAMPPWQIAQMFGGAGRSCGMAARAHLCSCRASRISQHSRASLGTRQHQGSRLVLIP